MKKKLASSSVFGDHVVENVVNCSVFDSRFKNTVNSSFFGPRQAQKHRYLQWRIKKQQNLVHAVHSDVFGNVNLKNLAVSSVFSFPVYENTVNNGVSADAKYLSVGSGS